MSDIRAERLVKQYGAGDFSVSAVNGMSFTIRSGEFVAVMGESGAGKSTLLSIMGGMNSPSEGRYWVDDIDVYALHREQRADFRREFLGFIFQSFHLVPYLTVLENTLIPLTTVKLPRAVKKEMAMEALSWVGLSDKAHRLPGQISGGECERAAIARAIVNEPPILLADEPTGNLDSKTSEEVMSLLRRIHGDGTTIIMVTHSRSCAAHAQRILRVSDGRIDENEDAVKCVSQPLQSAVQTVAA
jgi:putative ABC transport system ATP-binding protein